MPVDFETPAGQVRLLATDVATPQIFTDEAINAFLSLTNDNVKRAAALALSALAADEVLLTKKIRTDDLLVDGPAVAEQLRKQASDLNAQADADDARDADGSFDVIYDECMIYPEGIPLPVYGRVVGWGRWR